MQERKGLPYISMTFVEKEYIDQEILCHLMREELSNLRLIKGRSEKFDDSEATISF